jgi:hypothetical protein
VAPYSSVYAKVEDDFPTNAPLESPRWASTVSMARRAMTARYTLPSVDSASTATECRLFVERLQFFPGAVIAWL